MRTFLLLLSGLLVGSLPMYALSQLIPTTVTYDATACPAGVFTVNAVAEDMAAPPGPIALEPFTVTLPAPSVTLSWPNLLNGRLYRVRASVTNGTQFFESETVDVIGQGAVSVSPSTTPSNLTIIRTEKGQ